MDAKIDGIKILKEKEPTNVDYSLKVVLMHMYLLLVNGCKN